MAKKKKEELLFTAECTYLDDETKTRNVSVYKSGKSFFLRSFSADVCHPSVHTDNDIKREIALVYQVKVNRIKYRWDRP